MISRKNSKAARKNCQTLGQPKLGREVGDQWLVGLIAIRSLKPGRTCAEIRVQTILDTTHVSGECIVIGSGFQALLFLIVPSNRTGLWPDCSQSL